ncbi:MAG: hypothetical protein ACLQBX_00675 [Candidatus Limnocylindrales bacterium]
MRLREALKNDGAALGLAEATLTRLGLTDEAAVAMTDESHVLTGAVAACDKGLVVFTLVGGRTLGTAVHAWRDVSPPALTATTEEKLEATLLKVDVHIARPPIEIGTVPFDLGAVDWMIGSTPAAVDFWKACVEHAGVTGSA